MTLIKWRSFIMKVPCWCEAADWMLVAGGGVTIDWCGQYQGRMWHCGKGHGQDALVVLETALLALALIRSFAPWLVRWATITGRTVLWLLLDVLYSVLQRRLFCGQSRGGAHKLEDKGPQRARSRARSQAESHAIMLWMVAQADNQTREDRPFM